MGILLESKDTRWRVNEYDLWQNDHYKKCRKIFDQYMQDTNTSAAPWYIVDAGDRKWAELQVLETMISNIEVAMENSKHAVPILQNVFSSDGDAQIKRDSSGWKRSGGMKSTRLSLRNCRQSLEACITVFTEKECL